MRAVHDEPMHTTSSPAPLRLTAGGRAALLTLLLAGLTVVAYSQAASLAYLGLLFLTVLTLCVTLDLCSSARAVRRSR